MGKRGGWFSAIKRVFTPNSKDKPLNDSEKRATKEKKKSGKKGLGKLRNGETSSFIPLFREPSSIEKIFGDFEREQQRLTDSVPRPRSPASNQLPKTSSFATPRASSPRVVSPRAPSSPPRVVTPRVASPRPRSPRIVPANNHHNKEASSRPEPSLRNQQASATRIQAAYRGFMARRSFRALKGLVRLQGVVRGQNVKRQTANAMKYMQLVVRVQSQIQSRRIQMLESQARRRAANNDDDDNAFAKWNSGRASEVGNNGDWNDSVLTKQQVDVRMQRKVEAIIKRERAMAYAYSHQLWKSSPKSSQTPLADVRSGGFPWWYNWLERQLPAEGSNPTPMTPMRDASLTPRSSKSTVMIPTRMARTPVSNYSRPPRSWARGTEFEFPATDDQSLTSCPPFSVPNYMAPTVSAKAKSRANSNPKERFVATPSSTDSKRRLSFPFSQGIGSFKWNKASPNQINLTPRRTLDNVSVDSTVSMPATMGRKPFNRFV